MSAAFVHLRVHTEYSLVDSVVRVKALMQGARDGGMPAVAITDQCNLFAMVKAYRAAHKQGIKPLIGADMWLHDVGEAPTLLTLLCQNNDGFHNLTRLISRAYIEGQQRGRPYLLRDWLDVQSCSGLIALSGGHQGAIGRALLGRHFEDAEAELAHCLGLFGDRFYLEISRTGRPDEEDHLHAAVTLAARSGVPLVATNDVRFISPDDFEAHEARVCIQSGYTLTDARRPKAYTPQQYLRSASEMAELFSDIPEAVENSVHIATRCSLKLRLGESFLPEFPLPEGRTAEDELRAQSVRGLEARLREAGVTARDEYLERLETELGVIGGMGFPGYFLIVADFINWARDNGVPVGPGRGSGAGSLVAWCLRITDIDPIAHELLFERFLNPERVSMPDFDIDFCMEGRDRVIDYVAERYGRERVSQIITYGTMAARAVVRDVGRVLGHPYGYVDRIAKMIPFEIGMTLDQALKQDAELRVAYAEDEEVRTLIDLARRLEGLARNAGKHAGGVVIAPSILTDFTPLYCEEGGGNTVTQLDKDDVEAAGLVKFDFLGLRTLTIIDWAVKTINAAREAAGETPLNIDTLPMDDVATFDLLKRCASTAVFQLESRGMKELIGRLRPDSFDDIVALVALYRPGPLQSGMVDDFIKRKHGEESVTYPHPSLRAILEPTYGVILYQEQVMQIAQVLAGYTLGGADLLRRAMGKKKASEMAKQRSIFVSGSVDNGVEEETATYIFDLMEKFAGYGFNKSHSAAYAVVSYQTAWLKAHYPAAFMAAVLSADMDNTDKIDFLVRECREMGLEILPPDVNESRYEFSVAGDHAMRYGLGAVKGVGKSAVMAIEDARGDAPFRDLDDLCVRIDLQRVSKRALEALIKTGAVDALGANRASLLANMPDALRAAEQQAAAAEAGQSDLFGGSTADASVAPRRQKVVAEMSREDLLSAEKQALGLWLTGHPIEAYQRELKALTGASIEEHIAAMPTGAPGGGGFHRGKPIVVGGLVAEIQRRGNRMTLVLDDQTGRLEISLSEELSERYRALLVKDAVLLVDGQLRFNDFLNDWSVTAKGIEDIDQARARAAAHLMIRMPDEADGMVFIQRLRDALTPFRPGSCPVSVQYRGDVAAGRISLGVEWSVRPCGDLLRRLGELVGEDNVRLVYAPSARTQPGAIEQPVSHAAESVR